jgi:hypothetical protein
MTIRLGAGSGGTGTDVKMWARWRGRDYRQE